MKKKSLRSLFMQLSRRAYTIDCDVAVALNIVRNTRISVKLIINIDRLLRWFANRDLIQLAYEVAYDKGAFRARILR